MAHITHFKRVAVGHMLEHYDRTVGERNGNESVAHERSHMNYNLAEGDAMENFQRRLQEVRCLNRADVNVMSDWVVTAPQTLPEGEYEAFFSQTYKFLSEKYGAENVVSAWVHMDEVTPHLHFAFVPVVQDKKKGDLKVSANELITRASLKTFHNELTEHLENALGHTVDILTEATREGNKSIEELKRGTAVQTLQNVQNRTKELQDVLSSAVRAKTSKSPFKSQQMKDAEALLCLQDEILRRAEAERAEADAELAEAKAKRADALHKANVVEDYIQSRAERLATQMARDKVAEAEADKQGIINRLERTERRYKKALSFIQKRGLMKQYEQENGSIER